MSLEDVTSMVAAIVCSGDIEGTAPFSRWQRRFPKDIRLAAKIGTVPGNRRVLDPLAGIGAGDSNFAPALADRLNLHVYDRELLEQEAVRLGVPEAELEKIDEQPASIFQRFRPGSIYQRYFDALEKITRELAERGDVILVGRGWNCFLRDDRVSFTLV